MMSLNCQTTDCLTPKPMCYMGMCYAKCPFDTCAMINSTICIDKSGKIAFNGTCIDKCPPSHPIFDPDAFVDQCCVECPYSEVANNSVCISGDDCKTAGWQIYNHQCVKSCPPGTRRIINDFKDDTCEDALVTHVILGVSSVCLALVIVACVMFFRNPRKSRNKVNEHDGAREPLIDDEDQTYMISSGPPLPQPKIRREPMHNPDTSLNEAAGRDQPIHATDTQVKEIDGGNETFVKSFPQLNRINELVAIGDQSDRVEQFCREDDELSSIPTIVALKGFQESDNSLDSYTGTYD
ncbi:uncharacterized protein LOC121391464 [Gigantopelta aegis]|uniref:uncharacterized protein LOC121391464 n=1 Tax=Gigantopelta aegis TaxID=1735272 RepID=UPI001B88B12D|nr:uncharacterized protein LOC121391464 [Gigantopelta aegis]